MDSSLGALLCLAGVAAPMILWTTLVERAYRSPDVEMDFTRPRPLADTLATTGVKLVGLGATGLVIAAFYGLVRHYDAPRYNFYFDLLRDWAIPLILLSVLYVFLVDRYMMNPRDSLWHAGSWLLRFGRADLEMVKEHARCWGIKAFFIPFMFGILRGPLERLRGDVTFDPASLASFSLNLALIFEIYFATIGYILTIRPLDSHIRSANPFVAGWVAALLCYPPFLLAYRDGPLDYQSSSPGCVKALGENEAVMVVWLALLIATSVVWVWSTMIFGLRWSNLTHRGIITNGPYRYFDPTGQILRFRTLQGRTAGVCQRLYPAVRAQGRISQPHASPRQERGAGPHHQVGPEGQARLLAPLPGRWHRRAGGAGPFAARYEDQGMAAAQGGVRRDRPPEGQHLREAGQGQGRERLRAMDLRRWPLSWPRRPSAR